ncbi:MAG: hypothetical protein OXH57_06875 [Ekhidna sp.]|nr:hypothetical protein [Ekhidna sp.]
MEFHDYLKIKKIDPEMFRKSAKEEFLEWETLFNRIHPESFTQQKLFLINQIRRKYHLKETLQKEKLPAPKAVKPKVKSIKPKLN